jgi:hypothetical protein
MKGKATHSLNTSPLRGKDHRSNDALSPISRVYKLSLKNGPKFTSKKVLRGGLSPGKEKKERESYDEVKELIHSPRSVARNFFSSKTLESEGSMVGLTVDESLDNPRTGPGAYEIPNLVGRKRVEAVYRNSPSYSFPQKREKLKKDIAGRFHYSPDKLKVLKRYPEFTISREKKFFRHEHMSTYKTTL